jgi:hypothetical protein
VPGPKFRPPTNWNETFIILLFDDGDADDGRGTKLFQTLPTLTDAAFTVRRHDNNLADQIRLPLLRLSSSRIITNFIILQQQQRQQYDLATVLIET